MYGRRGLLAAVCKQLYPHVGELERCSKILDASFALTRRPRDKRRYGRSTRNFGLQNEGILGCALG